MDIALLPHELRALRMQRRAVIGAIVCLVALGVGLLYGRSRLGTQRGDSPATQAQAPGAEFGPLDPSEAAAAHGRISDAVHTGGGKRGAAQRTPGSVADLVARRATAPTETSRSGVQAAEPGTAPRDVVGRVEYKFGRARSFHAALRECGASDSEAAELIAALQKIVNFRRSRPDDRLVFERDHDKQLSAFEYRAGITEIYRAVRNEQGVMRGMRVEVPIERRRVLKGTYVAGTLGHSLEALGLGASLAGMVTEAFDSKISFTRDTRTGDSVKIVLDEEYVDGVFLRYGVVHAIEYTSERAGKLQAFWFGEDRRRGEFFDPSGRALHGGWLRTPLRYDHISSPYNLKRRHPILKRIAPHLGIDYAAGTGTPVWAAADGQVTFAGPRGANGNLVSVRHAHGYESHYAHLWKIGNGVRSGSKLTQRQILGFVGSTGRSTGPHLHFALKRNGRFLDPATQLNGPGEQLDNSELPRFRTLVEQLRAELEQIPLAAAPSLEGAPHGDEVEEEEDLGL